MEIVKDNVTPLLVALLTWGGVLVYLVRLEVLARAVEKQLAAQEHEPRTSDSRTSDSLAVER